MKFKLKKVCLKISSETILFILQSFLFSLKKRRGVERNLLVKRLIKDIIYSKENIKITLFYSENLENYENKKALALLSQGRSKFLECGKENLLPKQSKFVSENVGWGERTRTSVCGFKVHRPTTRRLPNKT